MTLPILKKDNTTKPKKTIGYSPKILSDFLKTINTHYEQTKWWDYCYVGPKENSKHNQVFFETIKSIVENEDIDIKQDTRNILNKTLTSILQGLNNDKSMLIELDNKLDINYPVRIFMENDVYFNIFIKHDVNAIYNYALKTYKNAIKRYNYNLSKKESGVPSKQKNFKQPKLPPFIERLIKSVKFPSEIINNIDNDLKAFSEQFKGCNIEMFKELFTSDIIDKEFTIDDDIKKYIVYKNTDNQLQTLDNKSEHTESSEKSDYILNKSSLISQQESSSFMYSDDSVLNEDESAKFNYQGNIATNIIYNTFILCSMDRKKSLSTANAPHFIYKNVNSKIIGIDNKDYQTITGYLRAAAENNTDFRFTSELQDKMSFNDIVKIPFFRFTIRGSYHGNRPALFYKYNYVSKKRDNTRKNFFNVIKNMRENPNETAACFSYITPQEEYFLYAFLKNYKPESFKGNHYITDTGMYYDNSGNKKVVNYGQHTEKNVCDEWFNNNTNTLKSFSMVVNKLSKSKSKNKNKKDNITQIYNNNISDLVSKNNKDIYENIFAFIKSGGNNSEITYFSNKNKQIINSSEISNDDKESLNEKDDRICAVMPPRIVTIKNRKRECYLVHSGKITAKRYTGGNLALDKFKPIDIADFLLVYKVKDKLYIIPISCKMYNKKISLINLTNTEGILNIVSHVNNSEEKDNRKMFGDIILDPDNNEIMNKKEISGKDVQKDIQLGNTLKKYKKNSMFRKILDILRPIKRYKETDNTQHNLQDDFNGLKDKQTNDEDKNKELVHKAIKTNQNKKHKDKTANGHAKDNLHYITRAVDVPLNNEDNNKNNIKNLSNFLNDILKFSFGKNYILCDFTSDGIIADEDSIRVIDGNMSFTNTKVKNIKFSKLNTQDGNEKWSALLHIDFSVEYEESKDVEDYSFRIRSSDSNDGANRLSVDKKNVKQKSKKNESYYWQQQYIK